MCGPSTTTPFLSKPLQAPEIIYIDCLKSGFRQLKRCICCCTYLHTPWCHPAGQSLQGTYQSNALCVGKSPTCTWCRSLCWNRTHSSLSCTLEGGGGEKKKDSSGLEWLCHLELIESWGVWGKVVLERITVHRLTHNKSQRCPSDCALLFLLLFRVGNSTVFKLSSSSSNKTAIWKWTGGVLKSYRDYFLHQNKTSVVEHAVSVPRHALLLEDWQCYTWREMWGNVSSCSYSANST